MMSSPDDVMLDLKPPSTSSATSSLFDAPGLNKQPLASDKSTSEQYNERGIDVGFQNGKSFDSYNMSVEWLE